MKSKRILPKFKNIVSSILILKIISNYVGPTYEEDEEQEEAGDIYEDYADEGDDQ